MQVTRALLDLSGSSADYAIQMCDTLIYLLKHLELPEPDAPDLKVVPSFCKRC